MPAFHLNSTYLLCDTVWESVFFHAFEGKAERCTIGDICLKSATRKEANKLQRNTPISDDGTTAEKLVLESNGRMIIVSYATL